MVQKVSHMVCSGFSIMILSRPTPVLIPTHEEMEIVSIIIDREKTHKDTLGNETVIRENDQARISNEDKLSITAFDSSDLILIDVPT